jgi:branched-chain amino acid transport system ATP-binding protein
MLDLDDYQNSPAHLVPFGIRRIVEIGRAIIFSPDLLLLDEPAAGMNHEEKLKLKEIILGLQKTMNLSILLVEHDMKFVMSIADIVTVLNYGRIIAHSSPKGIMQNPKVIEAYLGEKDS